MPLPCSVTVACIKDSNSYRDIVIMNLLAMLDKVICLEVHVDFYSRFFLNRYPEYRNNSSPPSFAKRIVSPLPRPKP